MLSLTTLYNYVVMKTEVRLLLVMQAILTKITVSRCKVLKEIEY